MNTTNVTIRELLDRLDGAGLIITDDDLMVDPLAEYGLYLDSPITVAGESRVAGSDGSAPPRVSPLAVLAFQPEAYDYAAECFRRVGPQGNRGIGLCVEVVPVQGEPFTAAMGAVEADDEDGQYKLTVYEWDEERGDGDPNKPRVFDIYDELDRIEVV